MKMRVETLMPSKEPDGANARANLQISISLITSDLLLFGDDEGAFLLCVPIAISPSFIRVLYEG